MDTGPLLCATDLGPSGEACATYAAELARRLDRALVLVFVGESHAAPASELVPVEVRPAATALAARLEARRAAHAAALEAERARLAAHGVPVEGDFLEGRPWERIVEAATARGASLVIVGAHGLGPGELVLDGVRARLLGSTADRVVRHAPCPVLVTPPHPAPLAEPGAGAWLVGVDLSEIAEHAARAALPLARRLGRRLELVHALPGSTDEEGAMHLDYASLLHDHATREAERHLREVAASLEAAGGATATRVAPLADTPADTLAALAAERGAEWVVVGTHGRTGLARWVLGSTAERVLRRAAVPVLVVPGAEPGVQT